eukprot:7167313-Pyramimonas_sp.AAC.1
MRRFGIQIDGRGFNKKPTGILSNHPQVLHLLDGHLRAGGHTHAALGGGSVTAKAERYTHHFVNAAARAAPEH